MVATVQVAEAKARLSDLLAKVEAGEEFVIARGHEPIARLVPLEPRRDLRAAFTDMIAARDSGRIKPTSIEDIIAWKHDAHPLDAVWAMAAEGRRGEKPGATSAHDDLYDQSGLPE
jgi:prevent-host-death family protein